MSEPRLRSVIDTIALEVLPQKGGELDDLISDRTMDYLLKLRGEQPTLSDHEIDRIARPLSGEFSRDFCKSRSAAVLSALFTKLYEQISLVRPLTIRWSGTDAGSRAPVDRSRAGTAGSRLCISAYSSNAHSRSVRVQAIARTFDYRALE